ncbi:lasso peptide isopeptide bond-forming cyclase [Neobacillus drentensis]|uniref:lasso peptide isopeptide bond-forming cyclase n=1 Tax=Neobacillus drentensis TaxID=220684 RepID=UPI002FFEA1C9
MSAIAGIYHLNNEPINLEHGNLMMKELEKYPADDIQTWHNDKVFLGCHAQWITPESVGEKLPYYDHERKLAITADAIIDNRDELFERLQVDKRKRKDITDSELILLSYHNWGEDCPKFLVGDFAFMIWDEIKQKLFGARDFSGARTLYVFRDNQRVVFCTTIKPLFSLPYIQKKLNEQWLAEYLAISNMIDNINPSSTVYKDLEQLPPSHTMSVSNGRITISKFNVIEITDLGLKTNEDYEEAFRDVVDKAVRSRLRTHRHVGAHLSGGLDSSTVVSFAAKALSEKNRKLHTYSSVPVEDFLDWTRSHTLADERPYIQSTVQYVGNITDQYLDFKGKTPYSEIDDWLETMEMPYKFFENSIWVKGIYEKAQQDGVGVLLGGARGNFTISWGPALDYYAFLLKKFSLYRLFREVNQYSKNIGAEKSKILRVVGKKAFPLLKELFPPKYQYDLPVLINSDFAKKTNVFSKLEESGLNTGNSISRNIHELRGNHFGQINLWNTTGTSGTKLSLRYSVQSHDPTNDLRVIRFCLSTPIEQFVQNGLDRALIRRATNTYLPDDVRLNQRVRGIQAADVVHRMKPSWNEFIEELRQVSVNPLASEFLNMEVIKDALTKIKDEPRPEYAFNPDFRILMRSLIITRFLNTIN